MPAAPAAPAAPAVPAVPAATVAEWPAEQPDQPPYWVVLTEQARTISAYLTLAAAARHAALVQYRRRVAADPV
jgi:hypothetical protein